MLDLEVFILELLAVDRLPASAVMPGEITALEHELDNVSLSEYSTQMSLPAHVRDNAVERAARVAKTVLAGREFTEVPGGPWHDVVEQLEDYPTGGLLVDCYIKLARNV